MARQPCPFYGFDLFHKIDVNNRETDYVMKDSDITQCALVPIIGMTREPYCIMTAIMDKPHWANCPLNTSENKSKLSLLDNMQVFPRELHPLCISLKNWVDYVISGKNYGKHNRKKCLALNFKELENERGGGENFELDPEAQIKYFEKKGKIEVIPSGIAEGAIETRVEKYCPRPSGGLVRRSS